MIERVAHDKSDDPRTYKNAQLGCPWGPQSERGDGLRYMTESPFIEGIVTLTTGVFEPPARGLRALLSGLWFYPPSRVLMTLAGTPTTVECGGTSEITTLPAPTTDQAPIVLRSMTLAPVPM